VASHAQRQIDYLGNNLAWAPWPSQAANVRHRLRRVGVRVPARLRVFGSEKRGEEMHVEAGAARVLQARHAIKKERSRGLISIFSLDILGDVDLCFVGAAVVAFMCLRRVCLF